MSIVTKKGDQGITSLMYNRQVSKTDARVEACGCIDELNSALGFARAATDHEQLRESILKIQNQLVILMGELVVLPEDRPQYVLHGFHVLTPEMTGYLEDLVIRVEPQIESVKDWVMPGANMASAALDMARTIARRAERRVCTLRERNALPNSEILVYLNRLSDLLWLLARWVERQKESRPA